MNACPHAYPSRDACPICTTDDTDHTLGRTGDDLLAAKAAVKLLSIHGAR